MSDISCAHKSGRSKSGCHTCRARKVRCDEQPGVCLNCEKLGLPCTGAQQTSEPTRAGASDTATGTVTKSLKRKRTFRSCAGCRASKTRCSGERPDCVRCRDKSTQCSYEDSSEPAWKQHLRLTAVLQTPASHNDIAHGSSSPWQPGRNGSQSSAMPGTDTHDRAGYNVRHQSYGDYHCLWSAHLPDNDQVRTLVEYYFTNIHPLRCFGFLHKPSFMQRLDVEGSSNRDDALLHIVCALGALFIAAEADVATRLPDTTLTAGNQWAKRAQQLILARMGDIMVENLMAAVLLHDYELRMGNFGNAFMLSGLTARMAQALQINLEHSTDIFCRDPSSSPSASAKESRRRLMWCCYITDSLVGSGVDQLTLIKERDIKIQLPCNERNFLLQTACITEVLEPGQFLKFLEPETLPSYPLDNMGIRAHFLRHVAIRRNVLKYIKHLNTAKQPWLPDSEFAQLDAASRAWYDALPASLQFTPTAMYIRKETSQLGALCCLHYTYHQTMCDLYRIGAPALYKLRYPFNYPPEQAGFKTHLQTQLFTHARSMAAITAEVLRLGPHGFADSWIPTIVYDCVRIMLYYLTQLIDPFTDGSKALISETIPLVRSSVMALRMMRTMYSVAELLSNAAEKMLEKMGIGPDWTLSRQIIPDEPYPGNDADVNERSVPGTPVQCAPDYVLNPLSIYRMARKAIPEKHAPEKQPVVSSPTACSTTPSTLQRRATLQHVSYDTVAGSSEQGSTTDTHVNTYGSTSTKPELDDLLSLFTTDPSGWAWQPSDTALGSQTECNGLPPWDTYLDQQLDAWMPMAPGQTQSYGY